MGHAGHGVTADGTFVPYTVPGDRSGLLPTATTPGMEEVVTPGPSRISARLPTFWDCGGCALQMVPKYRVSRVEARTGRRSA